MDCIGIYVLEMSDHRGSVSSRGSCRRDGDRGGADLGNPVIRPRPVAVRVDGSDAQEPDAGELAGINNVRCARASGRVEIVVAVDLIPGDGRAAVVGGRGPMQSQRAMAGGVREAGRGAGDAALGRRRGGEQKEGQRREQRGDEAGAVTAARGGSRCGSGSTRQCAGRTHGSAHNNRVKTLDECQAFFDNCSTAPDHELQPAP